MKKKVLSVIMALAMMLTLLPATAWALDGQGTSETPYQVSSEQDLQDAVEAGGSIRLTGNIDLTEVLIIKKSVDLDLNGFTIKQTGFTTMNWCSWYECPADMCRWNSGNDPHSQVARKEAIHVVGSQSEKVAVNIRDTSDGQTGAVIAGEGAAYTVVVYGDNLDLRIYGGTYSGGDAFCVCTNYRWTNPSWITLYGGTYQNGVQVNTIWDGTFNAKEGNTDDTRVCAHDIHGGTCAAGTEAQMTEFYGGTFNGKALCFRGGKITGGTFNGYLCTKQDVELSNCTINGSFEWGTWSGDPVPPLTNVNFGPNASLAYEDYEIADNQIVKAGSVAMVAGQGYETLNAAIAAAGGGQAVTLLADVTVAQTLDITKNLTINLNNHTITGADSESGRRVFWVKSGTLTLTGTGTVTTAGGSDNSFKTGSSVIRVGVDDATTDAGLVIDSQVRVVAPVSYGISVFAYRSSQRTLTLSVHGNIEAQVAPAIGNNGTAGCAKTVMNIYSTAVLTSQSATAIYHPGDGTLTINGAEVTGDESGIGIKSGTLDIKGGAKILCTGENSAPTDGYSNGINASGAAIQIESNNDYTGNVNITIEDATVSSQNGYAIYEYADQSDGTSNLKVQALSIKSGTFTGGAGVNKQVFCISEAMETAKVVSISGGTFSSEPKPAYLAEGYNVYSVNDKYVVSSAITGLTLNQTSASLYSNTTPNTVQLTATLTPDGASSDAITWTSSNTAVATVSNTGLVTAVGNGTATITAQVTESIKATCAVTVSTYSSGGGGGSGSSGNKTETTTNPDGSTTTTVTKPDGSITETTKNPDGSTEVVNTDKTGNVTTTTTDKTGNKTETVEKTDGTSQTTVTNKDGSSSTTTVDETGKTEAQVKLPDSLVNDAADKGEAVALPMPQVSATTDTETAPAVTVTLPGSSTSAKVEIPVEGVTPGTVAVIVKADGTEEIIKTSLTTENGVAVTLSDGDTVKIVDNTKDFVDVSDSYWGSDEIAFAASRELFNGTSATTFSPETDMNRAMIITVLARYEGVDTTGGDTWYDQAVAWAVENGVSDGTNLFGSLTREQLATMLYRYAGEPAVTGAITGFSDAGKVSPWAKDAMVWATQTGIIGGMGNGILNPQGTATRAQVATILMRFISQTN